MSKHFRQTIALITLLVGVGCQAQKIEGKYEGRYYSNDGLTIWLLNRKGDCEISRRAGAIQQGTCSIDGKTLTMKIPSKGFDSGQSEFRDGVLTLTIGDDYSLTSAAGMKFLRDRTSGKPELLPPPSTSASSSSPSAAASSNPPASTGYNLTEEEMLSLMKTKGIWNMYSGIEKYPNIEILRVGGFNEEKKYWPVEIRITHSNGQKFIYDCRILKDDYGDWVVRRVG